MDKMRDIAISILRKNNIDFTDLHYYSWPQIFASTSGPAGVGGCSTSVANIHAFVCGGYGPTVYLCVDRYIVDTDNMFEPLKFIKGRWVKL